MKVRSPSGQSLDEIVLRIEAKLTDVGFTPYEILNALEEVVRNRRLAHNPDSPGYHIEDILPLA